MSAPWTRCPNTHCERREECASPNECTAKRDEDACPECGKPLEVAWSGVRCVACNYTFCY